MDEDTDAPQISLQAAEWYDSRKISRCVEFTYLKYIELNYAASLLEKIIQCPGACAVHSCADHVSGWGHVRGTPRREANEFFCHSADIPYRLVETKYSMILIAFPQKQCF